MPAADKFPTPTSLFTIETLGGWKAVDEAVLRTGNGDRDEDRAVAGSLHCQIAHHPGARGRHRRGRRRRAAPALRRRASFGGAGVTGERRAVRACSAGGLLGIYLSVLVLLPVAALLAQGRQGGTGAFWREVTGPEARAAIKLTLVMSAIVVVVNAIFGTLIAWVLVRDEFPGKRMVNALIDLPFALPTIVAGVVLLALYGKGSPLGIDVAFTRASIALALLFVTLPFVVRSVQPVLIELDRSMEEAAASLGAGPRDRVARGSCCRR